VLYELPFGLAVLGEEHLLGMADGDVASRRLNHDPDVNVPPMRLVSTRAGAGVLLGDEVAIVAPDMLTLLDLDLDALDTSKRVPLDSVQLLAPVLRPPKFLAIGLNYALHVAESGMKPPEHQLWFNKQSTCVIGPGAAIEVPDASAMVDYEGELAFVIGRTCRHVKAADAPRVIAGYTIVNDVSVRDWQMRSQTMTMGKSFDTHGPMGPCIVTADELGDPHALRLQTWVNGEQRQDGKTDDLIFDCFDMVEHLSTAFTLEVGDVISTGTPAGVGMAMDPPAWLKAGDTVRIEIEGIGTLENPVVAEGDG
jgi:2-keto-4-pentenoate hydratase/2-oxohepta-3-ene-1,7-dioic acid hydratase in catechol pathway